MAIQTGPATEIHHPETFAAPPYDARSSVHALGNIAAHIARRTVLPALGAVAGAYFMLQGAHYETHMDNIRVEASTSFSFDDAGLNTGITLEDADYPDTSFGHLNFPDFLKPLPLDIQITAYPGSREVEESIIERYDYAQSIRSQAEEKARDAAEYFAVRAGIGLGGGLIAGAGLSELLAARSRRNRSYSRDYIPGNHPLLRSAGYSALALSVIMSGSALAGSHIQPSTTHYEADGLIGAALSSPNGFSNMHIHSPVLESILLEFQRKHACPNTPANLESPEDSVTITTYNIKKGQYGLEGIADQLRDSASDVIFLQEVTPEALDALAKELGMQAIPGWTLTTPDMTYGNAILTRLTVESSKLVPLPSEGVEPRGLLTATLISPVNGKPFLVADTHLTNERMSLEGDENGSVRQSQAAAVVDALQEIQTKDEAVIVGGDLNERIGSRPYTALTREYTDTVADEIQDEASFPANGHRFDNLLSNSGWQTASAHLGGGNNSDHCLLTATYIMGESYTLPVEAAATVIDAAQSSRQPD